MHDGKKDKGKIAENREKKDEIRSGKIKQRRRIR